MKTKREKLTLLEKYVSKSEIEEFEKDEAFYGMIRNDNQVKEMVMGVLEHTDGDADYWIDYK